MFVSVEILNGCMLGFELVNKNLVGEGEGWILVIDLFIFRLMIDK